MRLWMIVLLVPPLLCAPLAAQAGHAHQDSLRVTREGHTLTLTTPNDPGGVSVAVADLGKDGIPELIVGAGLGREPRVRVLRQDGSEVGSFLAYAPTLGVGLNVTACDLDADGSPEIITAPQRRGGPHVRVFDRLGNSAGPGMFAYGESFRGGVNLACGDLFGDARAELITLPGAGGGPHVRVWTWHNKTLELAKEFFAFEHENARGLVGTVSGKTLAVAEQQTDAPRVKIFSFSNDVRVEEEYTMHTKKRGVASIVIHNLSRELSSDEHILFVDLDGDGNEETVRAQAKRAFETNDDTRIVVHLSQQRLFAYRDGVLENSFHISSGKFNATPRGNHRILAKLPFVHYTWTYGENDPRNYDLGRVPYNLRIAPHIYLHDAYWHNNFGHPMSRGCVNVSHNDMKWLYDWASVGIRVDIVD